MRLAEVVGRNVRLLRKLKGLTQEELAHEIGIDTRYVGGIERAQENPSLAVIGRIADVFDVHPADLLKPIKAPPESHPSP